MKRIFSTKTMVATALGAALFFVFFFLVKIPSPVPNTNIQVAYGISAFWGAVFGPVAGFLVPFVGHALNDAVAFGAPWWSWVIASGCSGLVASISYFVIPLGGKLSRKSLVIFNLLQTLGHALAWLLIAPFLDVMIYKEPFNLSMTQGGLSFVINSLSTAIFGSLLLIAYSKRQTASGSLSANDSDSADSHHS